MTLDDAILERIAYGAFGRCVYRCDNDVVDKQLLSMEMDDAVVVSLSMECSPTTISGGLISG